MDNVTLLHGGHTHPITDRLTECRMFAALAFSNSGTSVGTALRDEALRLHRITEQVVLGDHHVE